MSPSEANAQRMLNMAQQSLDSVAINGRTYVANVTNITYRINHSQAVNSHRLTLIDRGANGGLSGDDVRVIASSTTEFADVKGIAGTEVNDVPLCTVASVIETSGGKTVDIFNQYTHYGKGNTIHSPLQMEAFGLQVDDKSRALGKGGQQIVTREGYIIPLSMQQGLSYMKMHAPSDEEMEKLPHVMFTSDDCWDPAVYDNDGPTDELVEEKRKPTREERKSAESDDAFDLPDREDNVRECLKVFKNVITVYKPKSIFPFKPDFSRLKPLFGWIPVTRIRDTIKCTTQWYKAEGRIPMRRHYKSRFPGANVPRREETVATDTIFSDTPAYDDGIAGHGGCTMMQFYCGCSSEFSAAFQCNMKNNYPKPLKTSYDSMELREICSVIMQRPLLLTKLRIFYVIS